MPTPWTPTSVLGHAVHAAGFSYDPAQDIIFSRMDAPQRMLGYGYGFDLAAFGISAVIDCEPIFFDYAGKHWMIELWKGQYGLETGCEIGVYTRPIGSSGIGYALLDATVGQRPGDPVASHNRFYDCASDADRLPLSATLKRNGTVLFTRGPELHWWLTGFKWGVLSTPSQLTMDVSIRLKDVAMKDAFVAAIASRPYPNKQVNGTTVSFTFAQPFALPQATLPAPVKATVEASNLQIVNAYNALHFPNNDPNQVQADFLNVTGLGILNMVDVFGQAVSQLAVGIGNDLASVVAALSDGFGVAASTIERWLNDVARGFASWVDALEDYLGLPLDFSCYVMIDNRQGTSDLRLLGSTAAFGHYIVSPPVRVAQGSVGRFVIQDPKPSIFGSEGTATYAYADKHLQMQTVVFAFECPTGFNDNTASSSRPEWQRWAKSSNPNNPWTTTVPTGGHPLYVSYVTAERQPPPGQPSGPAEAIVRHVTHTRKDPNGDITHLGGGAGADWAPVPVTMAIQQIRSSTVRYFTGANGDTTPVRVVNDPDGPYLRTSADETTANNLDDLPSF